MKKLTLFAGLFAFVLLLSGCVTQENALKNKENVSKVALFDFEEDLFDFGLIKQSGGRVAHDFPFIYNGVSDVEITGVPTSCACTSAVIDKTKFKQGDKGVLTVKFNPNLHEEPAGKFFKTVTLLTDLGLENMPEVKIWAEIDLDLGPEAFELKSDHDEEEEEGNGLISYKSITPRVLEGMLEDKDFIMIDVHTPEQKHIDGTDSFIPYDKILEKIKDLSLDKSDKIVLYCRSGSMSRAAAYQLAEEGYTNVFDLVGGKNSYDEYMKKK